MDKSVRLSDARIANTTVEDAKESTSSLLYAIKQVEYTKKTGSALMEKGDKVEMKKLVCPNCGIRRIS